MNTNTPKRHKLLWQSSYDRGLDILLFMWPDIKAAIPDAELHIAYGWDLFMKVASNNPERMQWKKSVDAMMQQSGIFHYGRIGQEELRKLRKQCGILAYPTYFTEIFFIGGVEAQSDGLVPVVANFKSEINGKEEYTALDETIGSGIKVEGNIKDPEVQKRYVEELVSLMKDKDRWKEESTKATKFAKKFWWEKQADKWIDIFNEPISTPKVSLITPTIREGFFNIMADNIAKQTYKGEIEWIIVDDYKEDRTAIAKKYADKYSLDIKYIRGDKVQENYERRLGLVRANNQGWQNATGELCVWLQDFVLMPKRGIEQLVDIYRHNPNSLIAPTDLYYDCISADRENKEDWWNGKTEVLTKKSWTNVRNTFEGVRQSTNPYDYEANYGAIPRHVLVELNGFYEFMDEGLGYDNLEFAYRAMDKGHTLIVDDTNVCKCINLWPIIGGTSQNILSRDRLLNPPRWKWMERQLSKGLLPVVRDEVIDKSIKLDFEVPKSIEDEDCAKWIEKNTKKIASGWEDLK